MKEGWRINFLPAIEPTNSQADWQIYAGGTPAAWPLRVVLLGDASAGEFAEAVALLSASTIVTSIAEPAHGLPVDVAEQDIAVILSARPGEFSAADIERWRRAAPLATFVSLLGSWCEGEMRTGAPWPGVQRVYWHQWPAWLERALAAIEQGVPGPLSYPATATDEERLLQGVQRAGLVHRVQVTIVARDRERAATLRAMCRECGYQAEIDSPDGGTQPSAAPAIALWDAPLLEPGCFEQLRLLVAQWPNTQWIVVANFPRAADQRAALGCGARGLLSWPLLIDDLQSALDRMVSEGCRQ